MRHSKFPKIPVTISVPKESQELPSLLITLTVCNFVGAGDLEEVNVVIEGVDVEIAVVEDLVLEDGVPVLLAEVLLDSLYEPATLVMLGFGVPVDVCVLLEVETEEAEAKEVVVEEAEMEEAAAEEADIEETDVEGTDVEGTDVEGTDVEGTDVEEAEVQAELEGVGTLFQYSIPELEGVEVAVDCVKVDMYSKDRDGSGLMTWTAVAELATAVVVVAGPMISKVAAGPMTWTVVVGLITSVVVSGLTYWAVVTGPSISIVVVGVMTSMVVTGSVL